MADDSSRAAEARDVTPSPKTSCGESRVEGTGRDPAGLVSVSKALVPTKAQRDLEVVRRADETLRKRTTTIMLAQLAAADIDDAGVPVDPELAKTRDPVTGRPAGWSPRKYNIARDSRKPERERPGYIASATRVFESYARKAVDEKPVAPLAVAVTVHLSSSPAREQLARYRVIDVEPEDVAK